MSTSVVKWRTSLSNMVSIIIRIYIYKVKVKWSRYRPGVAQRVGKGVALLFHDSGTRRGWVVSSTRRPVYPPGKTRYPLYRRLGGPQGRSGLAENLVPIGIRSRTVQPVVSRYTDWATWPTNMYVYIYIYIYICTYIYIYVYIYIYIICNFLLIWLFRLSYFFYILLVTFCIIVYMVLCFVRFCLIL